MRVRYPILILLIPFALGIIIQTWFQIPYHLITLLTAICILCVFLTYKRRISLYFLFTGFLFLGILHTSLNLYIPLKEISNSEEQVIMGMITEIKESRGGKRVVLQKVTLPEKDHRLLTGKGIFFLSGSESDFSPGSIIALRGRLSLPGLPRNPGGFNYRKFLLTRGIHYQIFPDKESKIYLIAQDRDIFTRFLTRIRTDIQKFIHHYLPGEAGDILIALILGKRDYVDREIIDEFARSGVIHVLAVSGLHVGFVILVLLFISGLLRIPRTYQYTLTILGLIFYTALVGFRPSVVRATIMGSLILLSFILQRKVNIYNSLMVAAFIILSMKPLQLYDLGFQLSFAAVFGIVYFYNTFDRILPGRLKPSTLPSPILRRIWQLFLVSLAAQLGTLPLTIYYFNRLPLIAILLNLLVIPLITVIAALGFAFLILGPLIKLIAISYAALLKVLIDFMLKSIHFSASLSFAYLDLPGISFYTAFALGIFLLLLGKIGNARWHKITLLYILLICNFYLYRDLIFPTGIRITFLDVGQGDCSVIQLPDGKNMLIDTGKRTFYRDEGKRVIIPFLKYRSISRINWLVLTHPHSDHIGGTSAILREIKVDTVLMPASRSTSRLFQEIMSLIDSLKIPVLHPERGFWRKGQNYLFCILHPGKKSYQLFRSFNNQAIGLKLIYGQYSFLFMSDIERKVERLLLGYDQFLRCDLLKVGHHGSSTSSSEIFLKKVNPSLALISVGSNNKFGHPDPETLELLDREGVSYFRTDLQGAMEVIVTAHQLNYKTMIDNRRGIIRKVRPDCISK